MRGDPGSAGSLGSQASTTPKEEYAVFARRNRIRSLVASFVMAGALALISAAVVLAETPYSH